MTYASSQQRIVQTKCKQIHSFGNQNNEISTIAHTNAKKEYIYHYDDIYIIAAANRLLRTPTLKQNANSSTHPSIVTKTKPSKCIIRDNDNILNHDYHAHSHLKYARTSSHNCDIAYRILKIYVCTAAQQLSRLVDFAVSAGVD